MATGCNKKEIIIVGYTLYEPMNYEEDGKLVGFDTELAQKTFSDLGYNVRFRLIEWNNKYIELNSGTINCIWNGFTSNSADDGVAISGNTRQGVLEIPLYTEKFMVYLAENCWRKLPV